MDGRAAEDLQILFGTVILGGVFHLNHSYRGWVILFLGVRGRIKIEFFLLEVLLSVGEELVAISAANRRWGWLLFFIG